ncbi:MAG: DUF1573 domain-containing protein [Acidobacteriota bacterium]
MKVCRTMFAIALLTVSLLTAGAQEKPNGRSTPSGAAPILVIDSFTHDFGEVKAGTPLRFAFKVKNEGKADLVINSVSPG